MSLGISAVLETGLAIIDKFVPDPKAKADAIFRLKELERQGESEKIQFELQTILGQIEINKIEAASTRFFVAGWRPAIGWTCAVSIFCYYVPYCLVAVSIWAYQCIQMGVLLPRPDLNIADLIGLVCSMLGVAGMRTVEKSRGVA
jgi:hypothetical protein